MNKISIIIIITIVTLVFVYALNIISTDNKCTGVRVYDCEKGK